MDKVLKRRLVGATILIALAVIFVPMLLDVDEEDLAQRTMEIDVPAVPERERQVRRIPLDPEAARRVDPDEPVPEPDPRPEEAQAEPPVEPAPELAGPDETDLPAADPVEEPEPEAEPQVPAAEHDGDWVVQVASFSSIQTANQVSERLEAQGHRVLTDVITRGETSLHRLRTGPYAGEGEAEQARAQIRATVAGVEPAVVNLADAAQPERAGYAVQVGSFSSRENADNLTKRLTEQGFEAFMFEDSAAGRAIWRVRVGPEGDRSSAEALLARLTEEARVEGLVVSHP